MIPSFDTPHWGPYQTGGTPIFPTTTLTFETIRERLFRFMREKAASGDDAAKNFLEGEAGASRAP